MITRREITRSVCWLPPRWAGYARNEESSGGWSRVEETWQLLGRVGYRVTTEVIPVHTPEPVNGESA